MQDLLGQDLEVGDAVLYIRGSLWQVVPADASIYNRGFRVACTPILKHEHLISTYLPAIDLIRVELDEETCQDDPQALVHFWQLLARPAREKRREELRSRREGFDILLTERGIRK